MHEIPLLQVGCTSVWILLGIVNIEPGNGQKKFINSIKMVICVSEEGIKKIFSQMHFWIAL